MSEPRHAAANRQATYTEVLANREYRALYVASAVSWLGDFLARAAVTALVFITTGSVILSAASFAIGYLPGLTCGPFLAAAAERYSNRGVMVACDLVRAGLIALVAIPSLPVGVILALLFTTTLLNAPFDASRSALLPRVVTGDGYVVAVALQNTTNSMAQLAGYFAGGAIAPFYPHGALLVDAGSFLVSAMLINRGIKPRELVARSPRRNLVRETAAGFQLVFGQPVLRAIAVLVIGTWAFAVVPEGLGAAWAGTLTHTASDRGFDQALIMMSVPVGVVLGGLVVARLVRPEVRRRLIRPLSIVVPLALTPTLFDVPAVGIAILAAVSGIAVGGLVPPANGLFVQALPSAFRARAFGVMLFGFQLVQAVALVVTGALADRMKLSTVVGWWSVGGVCVMLVAGILWPSPQKIDETIARVRAANAELSGMRGRHAARPSPRPRPPAPRVALAANGDGDNADSVKAAESIEPGQPQVGAGPDPTVDLRSLASDDAPIDLRSLSPDETSTREMVNDIGRLNTKTKHAPATPGFEH